MYVASWWWARRLNARRSASVLCSQNACTRMVAGRRIACFTRAIFIVYALLMSEDMAGLHRSPSKTTTTRDASRPRLRRVVSTASRRVNVAWPLLSWGRAPELMKRVTNPRRVLLKRFTSRSTARRLSGGCE